MALFVEWKQPRNTNFGTEKVAEQRKGLLCKHVYPNLYSQHLRKNQIWQCLPVTPALGTKGSMERERRSPRSWWPASLAK